MICPHGKNMNEYCARCHGVTMDWSPETRVAMCFGVAMFGVVVTIVFILYTAYKQGAW